jgi:ABC-type methionine transport system permease subunit
MSKGVEFGYAARLEMIMVVVVVVLLLSIQLCQLGRISAALQPHQASRT